jgi:hypothetical protein
MPQQPSNELQGPFAGQFSGLDLSNSVGDVNPSASTVFHNCDIASDGSVVRRRGTSQVLGVALNATDRPFNASTIRTKGGSEYLVYVAGNSIVAALVSDDGLNNAPRFGAFAQKNNVFTTEPQTVNFVGLTAPYDRLLIMTGDHPIVQMSFLERTITMTCTAVNGANATFSAPSSPADSSMWNDVFLANYIVTDSTGAVIPIFSKSAGFNFTLTTTAIVGFTAVFTVRQVTWQWWAESRYYEGADFVQSVSRPNVTDADQSIKIPERLTTEMAPPYKNTQTVGIQVFSTTAWQSSTYPVAPSKQPVGENAWGLSNGARYVSGASNSLSYSPFFVTFGAKQAAGGVGQVSFMRSRRIPFNGGRGVAPEDTTFMYDNVKAAINNTFTGPELTAYNAASEAFNGVDRVLTYQTTPGVPSVWFSVYHTDIAIGYEIPIYITSHSASTFFGTAQKVHLNEATGASLDGRYVRAYGLDLFCDYSKRQFHSYGILYRDRLVLVNPASSLDQLLISGTSDAQVPGEHYQFFTVTDALQGDTTDPFTVNVTSNNRESITAMVGWQDSIFVFTNSSTYALNGGESFGEGSYRVSLVSSYGAFNPKCVAVTNLTVLHLNRYGLFDLLTKPNTNDYGTFERSSKVRSLFTKSVGGSRVDSSHWIAYNESTNKLYVGLAKDGDKFATSTHLSLNLSWESWSTLSSAVPFAMLKPVQAFRTTLLVSNIGGNYITILATEAPHYVDYALSFVAAPSNFTVPNTTVTVNSDSRGLIQPPVPMLPGLPTWQSVLPSAAQPAGSSLHLTNNAAIQSVDITTYSALNATSFTKRLAGSGAVPRVPVAYAQQGQLYTCYPETSQTQANPPANRALVSVVNLFGETVVPTGEIVVGLYFNSVFVSPQFNLDSLGKLKRLKRLMVQFDTSITQELRYTSTLNSVRIMNAALVTVQSSYGESSTVPECTLVADSVLMDGISYDGSLEALGTLMHSAPLQGYGCSYSFAVHSVGAEAFKMSSFEIEVKEAKSRYVRR